MRLGIRAQLLLYIGALLVVAFVPLVFAVTGVARASLKQSWERHAHALGRAIAGHLAEARRTRAPEQLDALLGAQLGHGVGAIALYDGSGKLDRSAGKPTVVTALPQQVAANKEQVVEVTTNRGPAMLVLIPGEAGPVGALLHTDHRLVRSAPVVRLVVLYAVLLGIALLVFAYVVLTRRVVVPIEQLSRAAGRVADGARELSAPRSGARELAELGTSLAQMTAHLRTEETQLRQKVAELQATTEQLRRAQDTLVRSERLASVGRLAAGLAHEIGNPITAILGFQQLLLEGGLEPERQQDFLQRMKRETERVNRVLRDLLDFARPAVKGATGVAPEVAGRAEVFQVVGHVAKLVKPQKSFGNVEFITAVEEALPAVAIRADRLEQVLLNLLLNAADAVPDDGGQIILKAMATTSVVRIVIEDNGGGIDPAIRDRLFEPFVTTKEVGRGTGLGLAVCRGLVESAGGLIKLQDGPRGARFVLELPLAGEDDQ